MKPEQKSHQLLGITRSKAKMYEYSVPDEYHIDIPRDPAHLFPLSVGLLGELAARINSPEADIEYINDLQKQLQFSARFFDAYLQSKLNLELSPYFLILGSSAYYLCDLPGSSAVLAKQFTGNCPDLGCFGLENLLLWLLKGTFLEYFSGSSGPYGEFIDDISYWVSHYYRHGNGEENLWKQLDELRTITYRDGTPRQLLISDILCAIVRRRYKNSTWFCLPHYSGISIELWRNILERESFIKELWPAQHLLGQNDVFKGASAVIQMPTSAGKTKATEIIIRSAFLSNRITLAVIVAPFRALCHEIRNNLILAFNDDPVNIDEFSDVLQADFDIDGLLQQQQILVLTPEKLVYVLKHSPELAEKIGLLIYDEGHQFDNGSRGVTYELLLTSLKMMISNSVQHILISAVISNAETISNWLGGDNSRVIFGANLSPTYRTLGFASWLTQLGRLEFVPERNPDIREFFVPRIIEQQELQLKKGERKQRRFPEKNDGKSVALYLGLKLSENGGVAVFCGTKITASGLCDKIVEAYDRGLSIPPPQNFSDRAEIQKLHFLHQCNLGVAASASRSAEIGIFVHHNNTPHGIRIAIEYALEKELAKFVICTSTLAQGVNLPIRYLIVTSIYQGRERIKVRDFHNLVGRAGRAGMHTEGSILFADPEVYDKRHLQSDHWRWTKVKELLNPINAEPCISTLFSLFDPLHSDNRRRVIDELNSLDFVHYYIDHPEQLESLSGQLASRHPGRGFTEKGLAKQIAQRVNVLSAIESYLMSYWDEVSLNTEEEGLSELVKSTLAYYLADGTQKNDLLEVFRILAQNIGNKIPEIPKRKVFGKTLYNTWNSLKIEKWILENLELIVSCENQEALLSLLWPIIEGNIRNTTFKNCNNKDALKALVSAWIQGKTFYELFEILTNAGVRFGSGSKARYPKIEHVVDICENALAYDGSLAIGAVSEILEILLQSGNGEEPEEPEEPERKTVVNELRELQKRLKYGVPSSLVAILCEVGFADRVISMELCGIIDEATPAYKGAVVREINRQAERIREALRKYPSYYMHVANEIFEYE